MGDSCGYCGKKALDLPRCSACQHVHYCSYVCQRIDWKGQHKVKCNEICKQRENVKSQRMRDQSRMRKDKRSRTEPLFQKSSKGQSSDDRPAKRSHRKCLACGKTNSNMQQCSRCQTGNYCSTTCQRQHWNEHKLQCTLPGEDDYDTITTDGYRREEDFESRTSRRFALQQAKRLTNKTFVSSTVIDYIQEIPREMFGIRQRSTCRVFVGFISRCHEHLTNCIYLQDEIGDEVRVRLQIEGRRSHFRFSDVVPGRYLCIKDPYIEYMSGFIRVDDVSRVRVFCV